MCTRRSFINYEWLSAAAAACCTLVTKDKAGVDISWISEGALARADPKTRAAAGAVRHIKLCRPLHNSRNNEFLLEFQEFTSYANNNTVLIFCDNY